MVRRLLKFAAVRLAFACVLPAIPQGLSTAHASPHPAWPAFHLRSARLTQLAFARPMDAIAKMPAMGITYLP